MNRTLLSTLIAAAAIGTSFAASAQTTPASTTQRDARQEQRIENGLRDGSITPRENAALQRDEAHVDKLQARDLKDGSLSPREKAQLAAAQDHASRDIARAKGNGVKDGSLTRHEAARLENGQSHVDAREARAGADGHVGAGEQRRIARAETRQSARIHRQRHDAQHRA